MIAAPFILEKHYLDAITPGGLCVIGYRAELRWRSVRLRLASALIARPNDNVEQRLSMRGGTEPVQSAHGLAWSCPPLGLELQMRPTVRGGARRLHESPAGVIDWECLAPAASVELTLDGACHQATGYAERIVMTLPPHRLPIRTLRWGRFVTDDASHGATWIQWRGPEHLDLVLDDAGFASSSSTTDAGCTWSPATGAKRTLTWETGRTLRTGVVGETLLQVAPMVRQLAPPIAKAVLGIREHKRLARGTLTTGDGRTCEGWVIHEVVEFPGDAP